MFKGHIALVLFERSTSFTIILSLKVYIKIMICSFTEGENKGGPNVTSCYRECVALISIGILFFSEKTQVFMSFNASNILVVSSLLERKPLCH